ncbi:MAG: TolC family protein [Candidatus Latescibacter sp.]|nr:TolC family protein [Candidatus Latescibacter sp.]
MRICFFILISVVLYSPRVLEAQDTVITIDAAVSRSLAQRPELAMQESRIERARGMKTTDGAIPNPEFSYYREDLSQGGLSTGESTIMFDQPLDFLWRRGPRLASSSARVLREQHNYTNIERRLAYDVRAAFLECHYAGRIHLLCTEAEAEISRIRNDMRSRYEKGDISLFEMNRMELEYARYTNACGQTSLDAANAYKRLMFFLGEQSKQQLQTSFDDGQIVSLPALDELLAATMPNRPDLLAAHATLDEHRAVVKETGRNRLPGLILGMGYKRQIGRYRGPVFQARLSLPLFDLKKGELISTRADMNYSTRMVELLENEIALEIEEAYNSCVRYTEMLAQSSSSLTTSSAQVLKAAYVSYRTGEVSLVELLDAVEVYIESRRFYYDLQQRYFQSVYALERASGRSIIH